MRTTGLISTLVSMILLAAACGPAKEDAGDDDDDGATTPQPFPTANLVDPATADRIQVIGDANSVMGIFDPSYFVPASTGPGVMSYSSVTAAQEVFTRMAVTTNGGATWAYLRDVNGLDPVTISDPSMTVCGAATCDGNMLHETSSIVYDATEPDPNRKWKLFAHTYFHDGEIHYVQGWMSMYTAAEPQLAWTQTKLFGWDAGAPTSTTGVAINAQDIAGLEECTIVSEPAAAYWNGALYLALGCVDATVTPASIHIELLHSTDHAASWSRLSTPLTPEDVVALGAIDSKVNAAHLAVLDGTMYLSVTPTSDAWDYDGCWIFEFDDADAGTLARDATGRPIVQRVLGPTTSRFNGACATDAGLAGGWSIAMLDLEDVDLFQLYRSGVPAP